MKIYTVQMPNGQFRYIGSNGLEYRRAELNGLGAQVNVTPSLLPTDSIDASRTITTDRPTLVQPDYDVLIKPEPIATKVIDNTAPAIYTPVSQVPVNPTDIAQGTVVGEKTIVNKTALTPSAEGGNKTLLYAGLGLGALLLIGGAVWYVNN